MRHMLTPLPFSVGAPGKRIRNPGKAREQGLNHLRNLTTGEMETLGDWVEDIK